MWATVVQLVVLGARGATVLVVLVVLVVLADVLLGARRAGTEAVEWIVVVGAVVAAGNASTRDGDVAVDSASSPSPGPALQPTANAVETATNASGATRRGRATSRV